MNEKEPIDGQQKAPSFPPSLISKPATEMNGQMNNSYYQKGKLILPTSIWILMVIAGICFLTLLASLNKTISTLDTLVELEQEQAKHHNRDLYANMHHAHKKLHHQQQIAPEKQQSHEVTTESLPMKSALTLDSEPEGSIFALPSWMSLEPMRHKSKPSQPSNYFVLDEPVSSPIGASIIIATSDDSEKFSSNKESSVNELIDSMMRQFHGGKLPGLPHNLDLEPDRSSIESNKGPLIVANIDKINVNINTKVEKENTRTSKKKSSKLLHKNEEMLPDILEPMLTLNQPKPMALEEPIETSFIVPIPIDMGSLQHQPHHHNHHNIHDHHMNLHQDQLTNHQRPEIGPLANLLLELNKEHIESPKQSLFGMPKRPFDLSENSIIEDHKSQKHLEPLLSLSPYEMILNDALPLSVPANPPHSPASHGPEPMLAIAPALVPESEPLPAPIPAPTPVPIDQPDIVKSPPNLGSIEDVAMKLALMDSLLGPVVAMPPGNQNPDKPPRLDAMLSVVDNNKNSQNVIINEKPRPLVSSDDSMKPERNHFEDLFELFFGPPPNASLVVPPQTGPSPTANIIDKSSFEAPKINGAGEEILAPRLNESVIEILIDGDGTSNKKSFNSTDKPQMELLTL